MRARKARRAYARAHTVAPQGAQQPAASITHAGGKWRSWPGGEDSFCTLLRPRLDRGGRSWGGWHQVVQDGHLVANHADARHLPPGTRRNHAHDQAACHRFSKKMADARCSCGAILGGATRLEAKREPAKSFANSTQWSSVRRAHAELRHARLPRKPRVAQSSIHTPRITQPERCRTVADDWTIPVQIRIRYPDARARRQRGAPQASAGAPTASPASSFSSLPGKCPAPPQHHTEASQRLTGCVNFQAAQRMRQARGRMQCV